MVYDKEYRKEYDKQYYQDNKQRKKEYQKEYQKNYNQTPKSKKSRIISRWKGRGLKLYGYTYDELYEYYLDITHCEVCNKDLSTTKKCMDHCHTTGCFRWVLCNSCNVSDNWMKLV